MEQVDKGLIHLQRWFATGEHDEARGIGGNSGEDVGIGHLTIGVEICVAERAAQVAARETDEHRRTPRVTSLALQRIEDVVYPKHGMAVANY